MSEPGKRTGSLGCLGCFTMVCLLALLLVELAAVWWIDPSWFDSVAFWRGPRYEPDVILVNDPALRQRLEREDQELRRQTAPQPERPRGPLAFSPARASVTYDPARPAEIEGPGGATLNLPPGAIGRRSEVSMTPMIRLGDEMAASFAGPVYDLRVGDREHYRFRRPVTLTLPYVPMEGDSRPTIAGWEGNRWVPVPTRVDEQNRTLTAELPHASFWGALSNIGHAQMSMPVWLGIAGAAAGIGSTATGRAKARAWGFWRDSETYDTPEGNFKIHYYTKDSEDNKEHAVPDDAALNQAGITFNSSGTPEGHPLYVRYIGQLLELCRHGINRSRWGLEIPEADLIRYDVFLMDAGDYGNSGVGGPIILHSDLLRAAAEDALNQDELIRYTVAHELTHVAQDDYFSMASAAYSRWWFEMVAAYVGYQYWKEQGRPVESIARDDLQGRYRLLRQPMDRTGKYESAGGEMTYRYMIFLRWLDQQHGGLTGAQFAQKASESWVGSFVDLEDLDRASRSRLYGKPLADVFTEFAMDFYHDGLWSPEQFPEVHTRMPKAWQSKETSNADGEFREVTVRVNKTTTLSNPWDYHAMGSRGNRLPHLSAEAVYFEFAPLPETQKAKLVIHAEPLGGSWADMRLHAAEDRCGPGIPCKGSPGEFETIPLEKGKPAVHVVDLVGQKDHADRVTLLAVNRSLTETVSAVGLQRWLLLPPTKVQYKRDGAYPSRRWTVRWDRVDLKDHPQAFRYYEVLRRRIDEPDDALETVELKEEEAYGDLAPTEDDYVYTVKVVDIHGNKSHPTPIVPDPFVGTWFGIIREKHGLYLEQIVEEFEAACNAEMQKERARIARLPERTDSQRQRKRDELEDQKQFEEILRAGLGFCEVYAPVFKHVARGGVPIEFTIESRDFKYFLTLDKFVGYSLAEAELGEIPLERKGLRTAHFPEIPKMPGFDFYVRATKEDVIREDEGLVYNHTDPETGKQYEFEFTWSFARRKE